MSSGAVGAEEKAGTPLGLPRELFWDVDAGKVDVERHAGLIIERVLELGRLVDWRRVLGYYGEDRVKEVVTELRELSPQVVSLCCAVFGIQKEAFRCYTGRPFPRAPWIY
jgi:hypothetical protein